MLMVTVYSILDAPVLALMPVVARDMFSLGAGGYGLLLSFLGIGGLCGALGLAAVGDRISRTRLLTVASMLVARAPDGVLAHSRAVGRLRAALRRSAS